MSEENHLLGVFVRKMLLCLILLIPSLIFILKSDE